MPSEEQAKKVSSETSAILENRGWVLWKCSELNGEIILVRRNKPIFGKIPTGYTTYTVDQLKILCEQDNIKLVNEAVKFGGVIS